MAICGVSEVGIIEKTLSLLIEDFSNMKKSLVCVICLFLVSCASDSGVVSIGDDEYFIAKQASTGFPGTGGIKTETLQEASAYCKSQGRSLDIIDLDENEGPFVLGKYPRVELTFICE